MDIRKVVMVKETVFAEGGRANDQPITRAAALVVLENPLAGKSVEDLSELFDVGLAMGERFMPELVGLLAGPAVSYGKGALVGPLGDLEHGAALCHPKLGKPMRAAVGGGEALIPSNVKVAPPGVPLDVPFSHKDDAWSFDHFDTMTVSVPDAPRPLEIVLVMTVADGGRPWPRSGKQRLAV